MKITQHQAESLDALQAGIDLPPGKQVLSFGLPSRQGDCFLFHRAVRVPDCAAAEYELYRVFPSGRAERV